MRPATGGARGGRGVAIDDDRQAAEPVPARALEQLEPVPCIAGEHRRRAPRERRRDRPLGSRLGLEGRERERLAGGGEGARRRRDPLPLGDRPLERLQPLAGRARALGDVVALRRPLRALPRPPRSPAPRARAARGLPRRAIARASSSSRARRLDESGCRLLAQAEPLARRAERDEAAVRALLAARSRRRARPRRRPRSDAQAGEPSPRRRRRDAARRPRRASARGAPAPTPGRGPRPRHAQRLQPPARHPRARCTASSLRSAAARSASARSARSRSSSPAADSRRSASRSLAPCRR